MGVTATTDLIVYDYVTVETETDTYESVVAIQYGVALGVVPDPEMLEQSYAGRGPKPERLFKRHARYVVPWPRVVEIDRAPQGGSGSVATEPAENTPSNTGEGTGRPAEGSTQSSDDGSPDNVFDEV